MNGSYYEMPVLINDIKLSHFNDICRLCRI